MNKALHKNTSLGTSVYRSHKIEVRCSPLEGLGVFAVQNITKEEVVAIKSGHIVNAKQLAEITPIVGDLALQIHDDFYLSPKSKEEIDRMSVFINHSCDPNIGFEGQITYIAMRDINAGEELFHDYAMERTDNYHLDCLCGSQLCRRKITGEDWRDPVLQERYGDYFSSYILRKIQELKNPTER